MNIKNTILGNSDMKVILKVSDDLPKLIKDYYKKFTNKEILKKLKYLINLENQKGSSINLFDQIQELKDEANKRNLNHEAIL